MPFKKIIILSVFVLSFVSWVSAVSANHSWEGYHWARTNNPFTLQLGNNLSSTWQTYLSTASNDWSQSTVLDTNITAGLGGRNCGATTGRVEICNKKYGNNGWLGLAQIWINGSHITKGVVKLNDTYFNTRTYNTSAWRNLVVCQEVGHTLGLDHQDENFNNPNLGTCMDYTNDPLTNQHPNLHDYEELEIIYSHLDNITTVGGEVVPGSGKGKHAGVNEEDGQDINLDNPSAWGKAIKQDARGKNSLYARDLGKGEKVFTFIVWVQ